MSASIIEVKTPKIPNTTNLYKVNVNTFQLPKGIIMLDIMYRVDHKTLQHLNIPVLNAKNVLCSIGKICWLYLCALWASVRKTKGSPEAGFGVTPLSYFPKYHKYQFTIGLDTKGLASSISDMDIPEEARTKLQDLLNKKYLQIISQNATDIGRTNLIKLDIPMEGPLITSKLYTVLLKYCKFVDHKIKQLEEAGIILWSMSDWASLLLVVPKKQDHMETIHSQGSNNGKFNLQLCINYMKLYSHIQTAHQTKADGSLGKVISSYPLLTIDSILAHFNGFKYFSTINLRLGYYHIRLSKEAA